ncbi:MAG: hypothetical protein B6D36_16505 [Planctomycetes bacterium UTPLA1]|nr:MAG: hypothetical protein B6D36_16505 [Planctomycetes bacterium UTPLA1]
MGIGRSCACGRGLIGVVFRCALVAGVSLNLASISRLRADSVNSPNITMNADTNRASATGAGAGNVSVVINTITVAETIVTEYSSGAGKGITLTVRPGFQFDPASNLTAQSSTIGINGGGNNVVATVTPAGTANEVITFNFTSGTSGGQDIIRINGIRIRILSAAGAAGPAQTTINITTTAAGGAFTNQGIVAATINKGSPDHLLFSTQPGNTQAGVDTLPSVAIVDFGNNIVTNDPRTITMAIQNNPGAATLSGATQRSTVNGIAAWVAADDLQITTASTGYTIRATHSGESFNASDMVDSAAFDITAGNPGGLTITRQPVTTAAGDDILIDVTAVDEFGNALTGTPLNVTLDSAVNPGGWPLLSTTGLTKPTVNGVASWSAADDLRINVKTTGYVLAASGLGAPVLSDSFDITPNTPRLLRFVQQPTNTTQNAAMNPPVTVEIIDLFGNRTTSNAGVLLTLQTAPCGGNLAGAVANATDGLATFAALTLDRACDGDVLNASSGSLVTEDSQPFNVTGGTCGTCGQGVAVSVVPLPAIWIVARNRLKRSRRR